jgi:hypothetical protein
MAKVVADVNNPDEKQGGYASDNSDITGFSHLHDSGTGGVRYPPALLAFADHDSHRLWETSQYFRNPDALEILLITVSSPRTTERLKGSMVLSKHTQDILQSA